MFREESILSNDVVVVGAIAILLIDGNMGMSTCKEPKK